jgi:hypothetical protein
VCGLEVSFTCRNETGGKSISRAEAAQATSLASLQVEATRAVAPAPAVARPVGSRSHHQRIIRTPVVALKYYNTGWGTSAGPGTATAPVYIILHGSRPGEFCMVINKVGHVRVTDLEPARVKAEVCISNLKVTFYSESEA